MSTPAPSRAQLSASCACTDTAAVGAALAACAGPELQRLRLLGMQSTSLWPPLNITEPFAPMSRLEELELKNIGQYGNDAWQESAGSKLAVMLNLLLPAAPNLLVLSLHGKADYVSRKQLKQGATLQGFIKLGQLSCEHSNLKRLTLSQIEISGDTFARCQMPQLAQLSLVRCTWPWTGGPTPSGHGYYLGAQRRARTPIDQQAQGLIAACFPSGTQIPSSGNVEQST
jgi:hypothetical protein